VEIGAPLTDSRWLRERRAPRITLHAAVGALEEFAVVTTIQADSGKSSSARFLEHCPDAQSGRTSASRTRQASHYEYHRPTNIVANDWFNKHAELCHMDSLMFQENSCGTHLVVPSRVRP